MVQLFYLVQNLVFYLVFDLDFPVPRAHRIKVSLGFHLVLTLVAVQWRDQLFHMVCHLVGQLFTLVFTLVFYLVFGDARRNKFPTWLSP